MIPATSAAMSASLLLLGWSFYNLYVRKMGTRVTAVITWLALVFIVVFWTWQLASGMWASGSE